MSRPAAGIRRSIATASVTALGLLGAVAIAGPAAAQEFIDVDTEAELASAITTANLDTMVDVIHLTGMGFTLNADLPQITAGVTIVGPGSDSFTLNGDGHEAFDLVGTVGSPPAVAISGVDIANAALTVLSANADLVLDDVSLDTTGLDFSNGDLTVTDSDFSSTTATGARVYVAGDDTVHIANSTFDSNTAGAGLSLSAWGSATAILDDLSSTGSFQGFDLYLGNDAVLTASGLTATTSPVGSEGIHLNTRIRSTATLTDTTATGNGKDGVLIEAEDESSAVLNTVTSTGNLARGIDISGDYHTTVTINDAVSTGNTDDGLAVNVEGQGVEISLNRIRSTDNGLAGITADLRYGSNLEVTDTELRRNSPGFQLEAGSYESTLTIDRATIDDNTSLGGGGVGLETDDEVQITISNSTISNNQSLGDPGVHAVLGEDSSLAIVDSTISGNISDQAYGAIYVRTEQDSGARFTLAHSTVTENESGDEGGPTVYVEDIETSVQHSILAGNINGIAADLAFGSVVGAIDYSLIEALDSAAQTAAEAGAGNILGFGADLGPLADNGGPTLTHLPLASSRALDAGDPAIVGAPATDQRGKARIVGIIDIGAVEAPEPEPPALAATGAESTPALLTGILVLTLGLLALAGAAWRKTRQYQ